MDSDKTKQIDSLNPEDDLLSEDKENPIAENEIEDEEDEDGEGGRKGKGGGDGKKPPKVNPKELDELIGRDYDDDDGKWLEKIKAMALGPFSSIIPGASAFDAESDLKKKLLMGQVGIMTKQIVPSDIADPNLVRELESRLMLRQEDLKAMAGCILDTQAIKIATATSILGASAAALAVKDQSVKAEARAEKDFRKPEAKTDLKQGEELTENKKSENKSNTTQAKAEEPEEKKRNEFATSIDTVYVRPSEGIDSNLMDLLKDGVDEKRSFAAQMNDGVNTGKPATKPTGQISLGIEFNKAVTEQTMPVQSLALKQEAQFKINEPQSVLRPDPDKFSF